MNQELKFLGKFKKKIGGGGGSGGGVRGSGWGGQDGCERSIEVFVKIKKNLFFFFFFFFGGGVGLGGRGGCERRIEVFVKIQKKKLFFFGGGGVRGGEGSGWGVRVDVNEELKFL